jgi:DNA-binding XRE family transcriptional regulator
MPDIDAYRRLERKLRCDQASILTDAEIRILSAEVGQVLGPGFATVVGPWSHRLEDIMRWSSLKTRCEQARAERGVSLKDVAKALRLPKYRLEAVESGRLNELLSDVARRCFQFLGIEAWVRRWSRTNRELARRVGIVPDATPRKAPRAKSLK